MTCQSGCSPRPPGSSVLPYGALGATLHRMAVHPTPPGSIIFGSHFFRSIFVVKNFCEQKFAQ